MYAFVDQSLDSLRVRLTAVVRYRLTLREFDNQLNLLARLDQAQGVDLSELVMQAADDAVTTEVSTTRSTSTSSAPPREAVAAGIDSLARQAGSSPPPTRAGGPFQERAGERTCLTQIAR